MKAIPAFFAVLLTATSLCATPSDDAASAAAALRQAMSQLQNVEQRRDRVQALTETIGALETGMASLRDGLRRTAIQEQTIRQRLAAQETEISQLLGNLHIISTANEPTFLLHPMGPTGTARAGMMLATMTPALQSRVTGLKDQLYQLKTTQSVQLDAQQVLTSALVGVKTARFELSQAISSRTELPARFNENPARTALLLDSAKTLDAFANGLDQIVTDEVPVTLPTAGEIAGDLQLPVLGQVIRRFNESDAAGIQRPGLILSTQPGALVTTPASATIRYQGPLLDFGQVVILEPAQDVLIVLGGMAQVLVQTGEVVIEGAPLGLMAEDQGSGNIGQDTLYIEVRQEQIPVDPSTWFTVQ